MPKNKLKKLIENSRIYLIIIFILLAILCYSNPQFIAPSIIIFVLLVIYSEWATDKSKLEVVKHIQEMTFDVNSTVKNTLVNSPFPLVIVGEDGNIIWKGSRFTQEFANIDIKTYLNEILKDISKDLDIEDKKDISTEIEINNKTYKVLGQKVKSKQNKKQKETYLVSLFFIDNTEYENLKQEYRESNTCVGIITIDNYEEIVQRISVEERPQVLAQIEKCIYDWTKETGGLIIKNERETYIFIFQEKYLQKLEDDKFDILDIVKEVNISTRSQITLSIAISNEGKSNYEKYKTALTGIDIALGRGGDQAVIRRNNIYKFYGGRAQEVEKRTKVKARIISQALEELILDSENVIIMGHKNSDIDALGSSLGIYRFARTLEKQAYIVNETSGLALDGFIDVMKNDMEYKESIITRTEALSKINENTVLVIVDTHKISYVEEPELLSKTNKIVVIDHHRKSTDFIENPTLIFHEVYASSAAELVVEILQYAERELELKEIEVEALYAGIMLDTKNFTFKTGVRTFEAAAYLRKAGVDIIKVKKWFQSDLGNYTTIVDIVKNAEIINDTIGISIYDKKDKDAGIICAKAADELLSISNITASFVIGVQGEQICISGRSIGDINVQLILEKLGGGGHITNAGTQIEGKTIEEVKKELIDKINEYFQEIA